MNTKRSKSKKIGAIVFAIAMVFGMGIGTMGTAMAADTGAGTLSGTLQELTITMVTDTYALGDIVSPGATDYYYVKTGPVQGKVTGTADLTMTDALKFATCWTTTKVAVAISTVDGEHNIEANAKIILDDDNKLLETTETGVAALTLTATADNTITGGDLSIVGSGDIYLAYNHAEAYATGDTSPNVKMTLTAS